MDANFYFYFDDEVAARAAEPRLAREGLVVQVRRSADDTNWLALGTVTLDSDEQLDDYEERFEALADELAAEYDGYDRA